MSHGVQRTKIVIQLDMSCALYEELNHGNKIFVTYDT